MGWQSIDSKFCFYKTTFLGVKYVRVLKLFLWHGRRRCHRCKCSIVNTPNGWLSSVSCSSSLFTQTGTEIAWLYAEASAEFHSPVVILTRDTNYAVAVCSSLVQLCFDSLVYCVCPALLSVASQNIFCSTWVAEIKIKTSIKEMFKKWSINFISNLENEVWEWRLTGSSKRCEVQVKQVG